MTHMPLKHHAGNGGDDENIRMLMSHYSPVSEASAAQSLKPAYL